MENQAEWAITAAEARLERELARIDERLGHANVAPPRPQSAAMQGAASPRKGAVRCIPRPSPGRGGALAGGRGPQARYEATRSTPTKRSCESQQAKTCHGGDANGNNGRGYNAARIAELARPKAVASSTEASETYVDSFTSDSRLGPANGKQQWLVSTSSTAANGLIRSHPGFERPPETAPVANADDGLKRWQNVCEDLHLGTNAKDGLKRWQRVCGDLQSDTDALEGGASARQGSRLTSIPDLISEKSQDLMEMLGTVDEALESEIEFSKAIYEEVAGDPPWAYSTDTLPIPTKSGGSRGKHAAALDGMKDLFARLRPGR